MMSQLLLLPKIIANSYQALPELIKIVLGCITDSKVIEEEAKLEATYPACLVKCTAMYPTNPSAERNCITMCIRNKI